ncbi:MAG: hypothetical protein JJT77_07355 [Crocinitomicaceae bacterium]|nr:hypothetical protein [Crocinitomicaceae bacterium]
MIKALLFLFLIALVFFANSQAIPQQVEERWEVMNERTEYRKNKSLDRQKKHSLSIPEMGEEDPFIVPPYVNWYDDEWEEDELIAAREQRLIQQGGDENGLVKRKTAQNSRNIQELDPDFERSSSRQRDTNLNSEPWSGWSYVLITIAAIILGVLFYHLFFKNIQHENKVYATANLAANNLQLHEIPKQQIDTALQAAISDGNYRLAIRLHYLLLLKQMHEHGWINWKSEKTNQHYIAELNDASFRYDFRKCVYYFEQVWYGKKHLNESHYVEIANLFAQLKKSVTKNAA